MRLKFFLSLSHLKLHFKLPEVVGDFFGGGLQVQLIESATFLNYLKLQVLFL